MPGYDHQPAEIYKPGTFVIALMKVRVLTIDTGLRLIIYTGQRGVMFGSLSQSKTVFVSELQVRARGVHCAKDRPLVSLVLLSHASRSNLS